MGRDRVTPGLVGEFETPDAMAAAVRRLRAQGYGVLETFSPYPVPEAEEALGLRRSRIPLVVLVAGLSGAAFGYWVQWVTNAVLYPLNVGGRPLHSWPAYVPITFESGILAAALTAFTAVLVVAGLPRLWHPTFEVEGFERVSVDRFFVAVGAEDPRFEPARTAGDLEAAGARRVAAVGEDR